jgi:2-keto-4-pentenoate hydratase/2-oxohepta-3-ene-1,7-dioic acid hydratase in catechol pathway
VRVRGAGTGLILPVDGVLNVLEVAVAGESLRARAPAIADRVAELFEGRGQSWLPMIKRWPRARETIALLAEHALEDVRAGRDLLPITGLGDLCLDPPLPDPESRIFAMGGNFSAHASKMSTVMSLPDSVTNAGGENPPPWGFYVIPGTIVGPEATVTPPKGTRYLDYEAEVAVVLGDRQPDQETLPVWGYTAWNDFSVRDAALGKSQTDHGPLTWSLTKNFRSGNSCGPWTVVDYPSVDDLSISCHVNGELRQSGNTSQMMHSFARIASYISDFVPLGPGDMILSGTPAGTAMEGGLDGKYLQAGDSVTVRVDGVDTLNNPIGSTGI